MKSDLSRRDVLAAIVSFPLWYAARAMSQQQGGKRGGQGKGGKQRASNFVLPEHLAEFAALSVVLGRVTADSATLSALAIDSGECYVEYGTSHLDHRTPVTAMHAGDPAEIMLTNLPHDSAIHYKIWHRNEGEQSYKAREQQSFRTQRKHGSTFCFGVQGDSHPERAFMCHPELYALTLQQAAAADPDFYICMGDDFSISTLQTIDAKSVDGRYLLQRPFLGLVGQKAPVFLLNGNHEQASLFNFNQTDERHEAAVLAQQARNKYFPTVAPDGFFSGNDKTLDGLGQLKDYYAWTWGDALFVVLDNYWHSPEQVDSGLHEKGGGDKGSDGRKNRDLWSVTLGDDQYNWFKKTLENSQAKFKFVFAHHVLGTQRGGVDVCHLYEWGGQDKTGANRFKEMRPGWDLPIHDLMVKHGVTILFQGHDHLFCRQEKDGVIYQEVPMPADHGYVAYNEDRYSSGKKLPNSGFLKVTVAPSEVKVDYIRCYLPSDETDGKKNGARAFSYTVKESAL